MLFLIFVPPLWPLLIVWLLFGGAGRARIARAAERSALANELTAEKLTGVRLRPVRIPLWKHLVFLLTGLLFLYLLGVYQ